MKIQHLFCAAIGIISMLACSTQPKYKDVSAPKRSVATESTSVVSESAYDECMEMSSAEISNLRDVRRGRKGQMSANLLTATEINDFKKWDEWEELLIEDFSLYKKGWRIIPESRFAASVADQNQCPVPDVETKLFDSKGKLIWSARTDNSGVAQLWLGMYTNVNNQSDRIYPPYRIEFTYGNEKKVIENAQPYPQMTNVVKFSQKSRPSSNVDIFFIIDATGSMSDELRYLQAELYDIIEQVKKKQSNLDIRVGSLVYRDHGDDYLTRKSSLNSDINKTLNFLKQQTADGGGDTPEAVDEALYQAIQREDWNERALSRLAFLVLDAPPHDDAKSIKRLQEQVALAAIKGIRLIPLVASGMDQNGEYLMRAIALATNGTYVALTDDSGIGNRHEVPTTNYYKVEKLNDLLIRLIDEYTRIPHTINQ